MDEQQSNNEEQQQVEQQVNTSSNEGSDFSIKTALPILLGLVIILILFFKFVMPALEDDVDHGATGILEPSTEQTYGNIFDK